MVRIFEIITPAVDVSLLTTTELRTAAGVTGSGSDTDLQAIGLQVASAVSAYCRIANGGPVPTLRKETVRDTIYHVDEKAIVLSRRHEITITSVVEDGTTLAGSDYVVNKESGLLYRLLSGSMSRWCADKLVINYEAGFTTVPDALKAAATDLVRVAWQERTRDPSLKVQEIDIPGVLRKRQEFWVGSVPGGTSENSVPATVSGALQRFREYPA